VSSSIGHMRPSKIEKYELRREIKTTLPVHWDSASKSHLFLSRSPRVLRRDGMADEMTRKEIHNTAKALTSLSQQRVRPKGWGNAERLCLWNSDDISELGRTPCRSHHVDQMELWL
jgi:hypothetical protein